MDIYSNINNLRKCIYLSSVITEAFLRGREKGKINSESTKSKNTNAIVLFSGIIS